MPRGPRLDARGLLHHVMGRGLERWAIFRDDRDRADFVARLAWLVEAAALTVYAWALLRNHAHLLVRTGRLPLARAMRRLLAGYAGTFNRRYQRHGYLFQHRYKSIVCEEDAYFRELVRDIPCNPLRARLVPDLPHLARYPWCGPAGILGRGTPRGRIGPTCWRGSGAPSAPRSGRTEPICAPRAGALGLR